MIKDRKRAASIAKAGEDLIRQLFRAVESVPDGTPAVASAAARKRIVQLIGKIDTEVLWPIYKQHPDLEPMGLRKKGRA